MGVITEIGGNVNIIRKPKGRIMCDKMSLKISKWLLEQEPDGIHVADCMKVTLDEDIPCDMILEKLSISDCMEVKCTPEQEAAVAAIAGDVMAIGGLGKMLKENLGGDDTGMGDMLGGIGDTIKGALGMAKEALSTKVINAGDYVL